MNTTITVRGIDEKEAAKSDSIKNYVQEALSKLEDFLSKEQQPVSIDVIVTVVHPHPNNEVEIRVREPRYRFTSKRSGPELYKVVDEVIDIAFAESVKHKEKFIDNKKREGYKRKIKDRFKPEE